MVRIAAVAVISFAVGGWVGHRTLKSPADPVVARVNGEDIPESVLRAQVHSRFANLVLRDIVQEKAILQEAAKENIHIDPAQVTRRVNEQKKQGDIQALLKAGQLSEQDLARNLNTLMPLDALTEKHIKQEDEKEYLLRHREELETLKLEKWTYPDEEAARKALAAPSGKAQVLEVHRPELDHAWAELLFRLHPGQYSPVLRNEEGFHIFKVVEHKFEYAALKKVIREQLIAERRREIADDIRQRAKIEVLPPYSLPIEIEGNSPEGGAAGARPSGTPVEMQ